MYIIAYIPIHIHIIIITRYLDGGGGRVGGRVEQAPLALHHLAARGLLDALPTITPTQSTS